MRPLFSCLRFALAICVLQVAACGGGGGSDSTPDPTPPVAPGPTLSGPGGTWYAGPAPTGTSNWRGVAYGSGVWVAVGNGFRASSTFGATWTSVAVSGPAGLASNSGVAFANGVFIATSQLGVSVSSNGTSWTGQLLGSAQALSAIAYGNGIWVAADNRFLNTDVVAFMVSTTNGAGWSQVLTTIPYAEPTSVAFGGGLFVTVGYGGLVATSANGTTWVKRSLGSASDLGLQAVTYAAGQFVAVTNSGKAYRSADGITWTKATVTVNALYGVAYGNGVFVAVGAASSIYTSPDAATWTNRPWPGSSTDLEDVAFGVDRFVAAGNSFGLSF